MQGASAKAKVADKIFLSKALKQIVCVNGVAVWVI